MNWLSHVTETWSNWMLHAGWQAAIVALLAFVILRLGRNRVSSQLRYALLLIVLLKFATPPFLSLPTGLFSQQSVSQLAEVQPLPEWLVTNESTADFAADSNPIGQDSLNSAPIGSPAMIEVSAAPADSTATAATTSSPAYSTLDSVTSLLLCLHLIGAVCLVFSVVWQYRTIRGKVSASELHCDGVVYSRLLELAQRLGMKTCPELRISDVLDTPFAIGIFRPVIVVPRTIIEQLEPDQLDVILAHELAHVRRRDLLTGWIEVIVSAIWWFHPATWWLKQSLRQTREDCCDDLLIANHITQPGRYCETIIQAAARPQTASLEPVALGFSNREHPAGRRIRRLMNESIRRFDRIQFSAVLIALLVGAIAIPGITQQDERAAVTSTTLEGWGGWRNLPFDIEPAEETAIHECHEISRRMNHTFGGVPYFLKTKTRDDLQALLKTHPGCFNARHLLGTWHRLNGDTQQAAKLIKEALAQAPIILTRRYTTGDGKPVASLNVGAIKIECNRVQKGSLDPSLELKYVSLVSDAEGYVSVPVYDTVFRKTSWSTPKGYGSEAKSLRWFESKAKTGILPEVMVWKTGSKPRSFSRSIAEVPRLHKASGTDTREHQSGGNVYRLGRVARGQANNTFVSENGKGEPWQGDGVELPTLTNGAFMDHAVIDLESPIPERFEIAEFDVLDAQTSIPLASFQNGAGLVVPRKNRIHLFSMWETLPDKVSLVLKVHNYKKSDFRHKFSADPDDVVEVEQGDNVFTMDYLGAGKHLGWSSADGFVGEPESVETVSEAIFHILGPGTQKFSAWVVRKDGRRLNLKPNGWFAANVFNGPVPIPAGLDEIDHLELLPYSAARQIYFEDIQLPKRAAALSPKIPAVGFEIDGAVRAETNKLLAPLLIKFQSHQGRPFSSTGSAGEAFTFNKRPAAERKVETQSTVTWIINSNFRFGRELMISDGMEWHSPRSSRWMNSRNGTAGVDAHYAPLENVQAVKLQLKPITDR